MPTVKPKTNRSPIWTVGIVLHYGYAGGGKYGWGAEAEWTDGGFCVSTAMEGKILTRYYCPTPAQAIDQVLSYLRRFRVRLENAHLYYKGDGKDKNYPPPKGWEKVLLNEAARIGWKSAYDYSGRNKALVKRRKS